MTLLGGRAKIEQLGCWIDGELNSLKKPCITQEILSTPFLADEECSIDFGNCSPPPL